MKVCNGIYPILERAAAVGLWVLGAAASHGMIDRDGDGMSDVWEARFTAEPLSPDEDEDEDGHSNLAESLHGTDPFDPESALVVGAITHHPSAVVIRWASMPGIRYRIERSTTLDPDDWETEGFVEGQSGMTDYALPASDPTRTFLRVAVASNLPALSDAVAPLGPFRTQDTDHDGITDIDEWLSGTSPIDHASRLRLDSIALGPANRIEWKTEKGKAYQLQARSSGDDWTDLALIAEANGDPAHHSHPLADPAIEWEYRVLASNLDSDGDGLDNWEELLAGFSPKLPDTLQHGLGDQAELHLLLDGQNRVSVEASSAVANITRMENGEFEVRRSGGLGALEVHYTVHGTAVPDRDYVAIATDLGSGSPFSGTISIPFGVNNVAIPVAPLAQSPIALTESVLLDLSASSGYELGPESSQQINLVREVALNVMDYGAVGDGIFDDTSALQTALDALLSSTEHNTLFIPAGVYRLNTPQWTPYGLNTSHYRLLQMDAQGQEGRDLFLTGEPEATFYSTVSPLRAKILLVLANFRSLEFRGLRWEKDSNPLSATPGWEPNGAAGVGLQQINANRIERLRFENCEFSNCHRAITVSITEFPLNGRLRNVTLRNCSIVNPYGSNTLDGSTAVGGGTQVYLTPWVNKAIYEDNYFSGGPASLSNSPLSPGGIFKDGAHFGCPLTLRFVRNTVENMGVEGIYQTNENTRLGITLQPFEVPPADGLATVEVPVSFDVSAVELGQDVNIRSGGPNNLFKVLAVNAESRHLTLANLGEPESAAPGSTLNPAQVYLQARMPTRADIAYNWFIRSQAEGITSVALSHIRHNVILDCLYGIHMHRDVATPKTPATSGSLVESNLILARDPRIDFRRTFGIFSWAPQTFIENNLVLTPFPQRFAGVHTEGKGATILGNIIISSQIAYTDYANFLRGAGVTIGNNSGQVLFQENTTYGFDIGVGPVQPFQAIPHWVVDHRSKLDILPIDPIGLQN